MPETWRCGHPKTPENTAPSGSRVRCRQCHNTRQRKANRTPEQIEVQRARQRKENMTPEQIETHNKRGRKENLTPEQIKSRNARDRVRYAAGGPKYRTVVRASARKTIKTLGLDLDDYPRFKLLKDQEGS